MSLPTVEIDWKEDEATLYRLYRSEREAELRLRWHALWLVRQGHSAGRAARRVGSPGCGAIGSATAAGGRRT
jgi:hypothetical protein